MNAWHSKWGGAEWRVIPEGIETRTGGLLRTPGEPVTMRRLLDGWHGELAAAADDAGVPLELLLMTVATEGALRWTGTEMSYPAMRVEPGYIDDRTTPHRISFGPCHVLLSTYRACMREPAATRAQAMERAANLVAAARYIRDTKHAHGWDPVLVAASYNAGGVYRALPGTRLGNRWHIRTYGSHLDRAGRWYGDARAVLAERFRTPPPRVRS